MLSYRNLDRIRIKRKCSWKFEQNPIILSTFLDKMLNLKFWQVGMVGQTCGVVARPQSFYYPLLFERPLISRKSNFWQICGHTVSVPAFFTWTSTFNIIIRNKIIINAHGDEQHGELVIRTWHCTVYQYHGTFIRTWSLNIVFNNHGAFRIY